MNILLSWNYVGIVKISALRKYRNLFAGDDTRCEWRGISSSSQQQSQGIRIDETFHFESWILHRIYTSARYSIYVDSYTILSLAGWCFQPLISSYLLRAEGGSSFNVLNSIPSTLVLAAEFFLNDRQACVMIHVWTQACNERRILYLGPEKSDDNFRIMRAWNDIIKFGNF